MKKSLEDLNNRFRQFLKESADLGNSGVNELRQNLKEIAPYLQDYTISGHGTSPRNCDQIMDQGLGMKVDDLFSTVTMLFQPGVPYDRSDAFEKILHWQHFNYKGIVIIANLKDIDPRTILRPANIPNRPVLQSILPPEYIMGWVDAESYEFHKNPKFDPNARPTPEEEVAAMSKRKNAGKNLLAAHKGNLSPGQTLAIPAPVDSNEVGDVWE